jgi:hypothetical protein
MVNVKPAEAYGDLEGLVTGLLGRPVDGANVVLDGRTAVTDASGKFTISKIPTGSYTLTVSHWLYKTYSAKVEIKEGKNSITVGLSLSDTAKISLGAAAVLGGIGIYRLVRK